MSSIDCYKENRRIVPLSRVVAASIIDVREDINRTQQLHSHWAARGLRKLQTEILKQGKRKALLTVNRSTGTATLPPDFGEELFVGYLDNCGKKIPFKIRTDLADLNNIEDVECEDKCPRCNQDRAICEDLKVTEEIELVVLNNTTYENSSVKKLYPNGDYYLETTTWVQSVDTSPVTVSKIFNREFIAHLDLKPCGCLEVTEENIETLRTCSPDCYACHFAPCGEVCGDGGYQIFEETGVLRLINVRTNKIYIEYYGFMPKRGGQYYVPEVAFETLVEWTKFKSIANKINVSVREKDWQLAQYKRERANMEKVLGRISLSAIIQAASLTPKFDGDYTSWYCCFGGNEICPIGSVVPGSISSISSGGTRPGGGSGGDRPLDCCENTTIIRNGCYELAVKVDGNPGSPVENATSYQNDLLKGATDINYIIVAKTIETRAGLNDDFVFDNVTGTVDRSPQKFAFGDTLIIHYNKTT